MNKLNKKGFTLIELLAVIAILLTIMLIAIPSITSSLERSRTKQLDAKKKLIISAAEIYVSDNKNDITSDKNICIDTLTEVGLLKAEEILDSNGNKINGCVKYTKVDSSFTFDDTCTCS